MAKPSAVPGKAGAAGRLGRLLLVTGALSLPFAAGCAGLVLLDGASAGGAVLAWLGAGLGCALLVRHHLGVLDRLGEGLRRLTDRQGAADHRFAGAIARRPGPAAAPARELHRWLRRNARELARFRAGLRSLEQLVDQLPDPLVLLDGQDRVVLANRAAAMVFGAPLAGREFATILRDPGVNAAIARAMAGAAGEDAEFSLPGATVREFRVRAVAMAEQAAITRLLLFHEITEARQNERTRADFVANVSHELRTPLATLAGFVETLKGAARDDEAARDGFLDLMQGQADRMARLIDDLLSLARIESREHTRPAGRVDVAAVLESVARPLRAEAGRQGARIRIELAPDLPAIAGDGDEIAQVVQNLIDNALKYGAGKTVQVQAVPAPEPPPAFPDPGAPSVAIAVRDQGPGIAAEHLPRLTERFYRVDAARSRAMGGTGLGLAIVKHIVNRHRGALRIDSEIGEGTGVTVFLPVAPEPGAGSDR